MAMEIRSTPALIGISRTPSSISIEQPKLRVEGSLSQAQVRITASLPKVTIDQEAAFNEAGLKNNGAFQDEAVALAKQKAQEGVARRSQQGDQLAKIHQKGNPIADQAPQNAFDQFQHEFGMVTMPRSGAQIDVIEGNIDIQVSEGEITGSIIARKPIINNDQGKVEIYLRQKSSISMRYLGENVDLKL